MNILVALLIAYAFYLIQDRVYNRIWNKNLTVEAFFRDKTLMEGESGSITEIISNGKLLPLPLLRVRFEVKKGLDFGFDANVSVSDKSYRSDIYTVMPCRRIRRNIEFKCSKRGFYEINNISLVSNDLLFSRGLVENRSLLSTLTVFPREVDTDRLFIPYNQMMGMVISKRFAYEDPFEFRNIRRYESYDSMRDINWKASARTGELMVNTHDYTASPEICILLDFDSDTEWSSSEALEEQIRIAVTMSRLFISQGVPVSIVSNGRDILTGEELFISSGCGSNHTDIIREALARLDLEKQIDSFMPKLDKINKSNCLYLLISSSYSEELQKKYANICKNNIGSEWIVTYRSVDEIPTFRFFCGAFCREVSK